MGALMGKLGGVVPALWMEALPKLAAGDPGQPQDEAEATYYGHIPDERAWKAIDWSQPARTVHNVVRSSAYLGALPPGALGDLDGAPHRITRTRLLPDSQGDGPPGTIVARDGDTVLVQCGDGLLGITEYAAV